MNFFTMSLNGLFGEGGESPVGGFMGVLGGPPAVSGVMPAPVFKKFAAADPSPLAVDSVPGAPAIIDPPSVYPNAGAAVIDPAKPVPNNSGDKALAAPTDEKPVPNAASPAAAHGEAPSAPVAVIPPAGSAVVAPAPAAVAPLPAAA